MPGQGIEAGKLAAQRERDTELDALTAEFVGWHCWRGPGGLVYGRLLLSSPPIVLRDETIPGLREQMRAKAQEVTDRWGR